MCSPRPITAKSFQSTLPTRGSDAAFSAAAFSDKNFNPRSPRGGATRRETERALAYIKISIHAPHEGERQLAVSVLGTGAKISIHAPHEGERRAVRYM